MNGCFQAIDHGPSTATSGRLQQSALWRLAASTSTKRVHPACMSQRHKGPVGCWCSPAPSHADDVLRVRTAATYASAQTSIDRLSDIRASLSKWVRHEDRGRHEGSGIGSNVLIKSTLWRGCVSSSSFLQARLLREFSFIPTCERAAENEGCCSASHTARIGTSAR